MTGTRPHSGIDPRFDPRFQRGYVPDVTEEHQHATVPRESVVAPPARPTRPPSDSATAPEAVPISTRPTPEDDRAPRAGADDGDPPEPSPDAFETTFDEVDDEPSPADPWFIAAWAVAALAVVIGGAFWWAGMMAENPFSGARQSDRWLQYVGWVVAPALVQGGLIGIVAMLVWTGIRRARRHGEPS